MYGTTTGAAATGGVGALAVTGANSFWLLVTTVAVAGAGILLLRLRPKKNTF